MSRDFSNANDRHRTLAELVAATSEKLDNVSQSITSQAFNLGCTVGVIPAGLIILTATIISNGNITAIMVTILVTVILVTIFASFAAYLARSRTFESISREEVFPWMESEMKRLGIGREELTETIDRLTPQGGLLRRYLEIYPRDQRAQMKEE